MAANWPAAAVRFSSAPHQVLVARQRAAGSRQAFEVAGPPPPKLDNVDLFCDRSCLDFRLDFFTQHFPFLAYERPDPSRLVGSRAVEYLDRMLREDSLGLQRAHGFAFLYELLTGGVRVHVVPAWVRILQEVHDVSC